MLDEPLAELIPRLRELLLEDSDDRWNKFSPLLDDLTAHIRSVVKIPESSASFRSKKSINPENHKDIQKRYQRNRRQGIRAILGESNKECNVPIEEITSAFAQNASEGVALDNTFPHP